MGRAGPLIRHGPPHETSWNGLPLRATRTSPTATEWLLGPWEYDDRGNVAFESEGGIHHADQHAGSLLTDIVHYDCLSGTCDRRWRGRIGRMTAWAALWRCSAPTTPRWWAPTW